tara:strand:- start:581 stop:781 length:201 start_codon:yes stop_codon:yes gene_type:complete
MPLLKMQFQTKQAKTMGSLLPIQQSLVAPPQPVVIKPLGSYRTKPLLSGMVQRIRDLPTGCKSCGR